RASDIRGDPTTGRGRANRGLPAGARFRRSSNPGQSVGLAARDRRGWWRCGACMWVIATALASCQQAAEPPTLGEPVAEAAGYPSLHTVPPRPQLSYPVEQRQAIIEGLIADRENARYSNQAVRYRTSLSGLP